MIARSLFRLVAAAVATLIGVVGCERKVNTLDSAPFPKDPEVFVDGFGTGVTFQAFGGSKVDALAIDLVEKHRGSRSLKVTVPNAGDLYGGYAGGAFTTSIGRDLSGYNALTFWAKASITATLDLAGFGNNNTPTARFVAQQTGLKLTTIWTKYIIPIPLPEKLAAEQGLFHFAEAPENGVGYQIWFDDVQFEANGTIAHPRPAIKAETFNAQVGDSSTVQGTAVTFDVGGADQIVIASPGYFTFTSSNQAVATVTADGKIRAVGLGSATISAKVGAVDAAGTVKVNVAAAPPVPTVPAPTPTLAANKVISLFSNAYTNVTVDTWSADWDNADLADVKISGNDTKKYTNLVFAGIEFTSKPVNAATMTDFHMDIWTPDPTAAPASFRIKLVDFGADGKFGGGDDKEHELTFTASSTPALATGSWVGLDIPLSRFTGLTTKGHLAQMIISGDPKTVYVDNVYFYTSATQPTEPAAAAPTPTLAANKVISLFSNAYTNVMVDTWSADWDNADLADVKISGNDTKKYTNLVFAGIEFTSKPVNASTMTDFHMDIWTPDPTAAPAAFRIKLVDFGADGVFGGGDDKEHELTFTASSTPALATGSWVGLDIPLSRFTGLTTKGHLAQMIISGDPKTVYVDNVYFYTSATQPTEPAAAAPTPTLAANKVISLFSNAYTNVTVDTWSADWDNADLADVKISGNDTKKYTNLVFAGIEFTSKPVNAATMTDFHMDIWTPDPTAAPASFRIKLVDFGADGKFGGGDDKEHELTFNASSTPVLATGSWVGLDVPLSRFTGLTTKGHLAQMIISGDPKTVYVDNVYLYTSGTQVAEPTAPAPTPTLPASKVISMFSNAYTNVTVDTWSADWDNADVADVKITGNDTKKYTNLVFAGIEFTSKPINASAMTDFHMDIWTPDPTAAPAAFRVKLVDFGADGVFGGGDDKEHELTFNASSTPVLATGSWVGLDVPLSRFTGLTTKGHLAQMIISGDPKTVYVDNVYFYTSATQPTEPSAPAPTPTLPASKVISMFSNAYTNVTVDTWSADWDNADVADVKIIGNDTKKYTNLAFAGIEFTSQLINAATMTDFHMDIWTPDPTAAPAAFRIKLVDFGADGVFGGGDDKEHELTFTASSTPALATGSWVGLDIPLSRFTGLTTKGHLAQMIISGDSKTVYVDNVYFYTSATQPTEPTAPAPTPTVAAGDVISLFSNAYTNVMVDTWSADWDNADVADVKISGNDTKKYTNLVFAGIEFTSQPINAAAMVGFHMDIWTPDPTAAPAAFRIKLVDFGADGKFGGGDDVEHELTLNAASTPALATGTWVGLEIPLSRFTGLTTKGHLAQMIISGDPKTVYVDNIFLHK